MSSDGSQARQAPVERVIGRGLEEAEGIGKPLSSRTRQRQRSVEAYLKGGAAPRWMQRIGDIDRGIAQEERRLARSHRALAAELEGRPAEFARRWREVAQRWNFAELNELIAEHNEWYPIERDLPMDLRTRDYVLVNGRSYRRPLLGAEWILERFPAESSDGGGG